MSSWKLIVSVAVGLVWLVLFFTFSGEVVERDTFLDAFGVNKNSAVAVVGVLEIHDQRTYVEAKSRLYSLLSDDLRRSIFPSAEFEGGSLGRVEVEIKDVKGDLTKSPVYYFKLDVLITVGGRVSEATFIVGAQAGRVFSIERI